MKISTIILGVITTTVLLVSCGGKGEKKSDSKEQATVAEKPAAAKQEGIQGAWEIKRALGDMADLNVGTVYEFKGDKLTFNPGQLTENPGTTKITDSTFTFQANGNELKFDYKYKIVGDTMIVRMDGADQTFYMTRK